MEEKKVIREEPEIRSTQNISGMRKIEHELKSLEQLVRNYTAAGKPLPPMLKARLSSLRTNTLALQRIKGRE